MSLPGKQSGAVISVERALTLLEAFEGHGGWLGVQDLSQRTGLSPSTTHRLLAVLCTHGYVRQDTATRKYSLGLRLVVLGTRVLEHLDLRTVARRHLEWLSAVTEETCHLAIPNGDGLLYVDQVRSSTQNVVISVRVGSHGQIHCTASGKVIMAYQPPDRAAAIFAGVARRHTANTILDPEIYRVQLKAVRKQGYALGIGEWREEVSSAAAPVFDHRGQVVAACGVVGLTSRLTGARQAEVVGAVREAAAGIGSDLGYGGVPGIIGPGRRRPLGG